MHESRNKLTGQRADVALHAVPQFAAEVVARLAAREGRSDAALRAGFLEKFLAAVRSTDPLAFEALKPEIRRARITAAMLADIYIPRAARLLGADWESDCLSFAEVTIGSARLQALLRDIGSAWNADDRQGMGTMLVVLPAGEQHTLGAMVLTSQLRRTGVSVNLQIGTSAAGLRTLLQDRRFDGVMLSVGSEAKLDACAKMVRMIKDISGGAMRVGVGGAVLERISDGAGMIGADVATNDLQLALDAIGLVPKPASAVERV